MRCRCITGFPCNNTAFLLTEVVVNNYTSVNRKSGFNHFCTLLYRNRITTGTLQNVLAAYSQEGGVYTPLTSMQPGCKRRFDQCPLPSYLASTAWTSAYACSSSRASMRFSWILNMFIIGKSFITWTNTKRFST